MTRNESHMGFLLEPVHSSTPPLVSGTVRSRPLAAKVIRRLLLFIPSASHGSATILRHELRL